MKTIPYSIVCEDAAHYYFVRRLLTLYKGNVKFQMSEECYTRYKCSTKTQVLHEYINIANQAFREFPIQILFVVTDHDDDIRASNVYHKELHEELFAQVKDKVIISIPMRAIEHWLRYLQWIKDNPTATKNITMEGENRAESKMKVYSSKRPSKDKIESVTNELLDQSYIPRLVSLSQSFNHLYEQIKKVS
jgi:hypothetical protein